MEKLWSLPPLTKVIEAYGCLGDNRIVISDDSAKVYSSSRGKYYTVNYDSKENTISSNDNVSFYVGYMGYPVVAFLMKKGLVKYKPEFTEALAGFAWKDVNQTNNNNFAKTNEMALEMSEKRGYQRSEIEADAKSVLAQIKKIKLLKAKSIRPPKGY